RRGRTARPRRDEIVDTARIDPEADESSAALGEQAVEERRRALCQQDDDVRAALPVELDQRCHVWPPEASRLRWCQAENPLVEESGLRAPRGQACDERETAGRRPRREAGDADPIPAPVAVEIARDSASGQIERRAPDCAV